MRRSESDELYLYLMRKLDKLESDLTDSQNHLRLARRPDELDCLAHIRAINRFQMFMETSRDVAAILRLHEIKEKEAGL